MKSPGVAGAFAVTAGGGVGIAAEGRPGAVLPAPNRKCAATHPPRAVLVRRSPATGPVRPMA